METRAMLWATADIRKADLLVRREKAAARRQPN
jgi:hypothetical protein